MKRSLPICLFFLLSAIIYSCRNESVHLLTKKWECVQVENIIPPGINITSPEDSVNAIQLQALVRSINWTFKNNMRFECAVGDRITLKGRYELQESDKMLVCISESKNSINRYHISVLSENELVLKSISGYNGLVLHFKPY
ncbi:MAG: hypothetical protein IPG38_07575 [Chitinophagaceae bacterium]|nr:hypothetical protein [Chitinophagaceae bacterium]